MTAWETPHANGGGAKSTQSGKDQPSSWRRQRLLSGHHRDGGLGAHRGRAPGGADEDRPRCRSLKSSRNVLSDPQTDTTKTPHAPR